jgi:hypothetical protein
MIPGFVGEECSCERVLKSGANLKNIKAEHELEKRRRRWNLYISFI